MLRAASKCEQTTRRLASEWSIQFAIAAALIRGMPSIDAAILFLERESDRFGEIASGEPRHRISNPKESP